MSDQTKTDTLIALICIGSLLIVVVLTWLVPPIVVRLTVSGFLACFCVGIWRDRKALS